MIQFINHQPKLALPTLQGYDFEFIFQIVRCQAEASYTQIFFQNNRTVLGSKNLKFFDGLLSTHGFIRIHRSHLINVRYVKSFIKGKSPQVILEDGTILSVAPGRRAKVEKYLVVPGLKHIWKRYPDHFI